jgi:hypothetical protein
MLLLAALIYALGVFGGPEAPFASFDVSHLCTSPWTSDAGRAGAQVLDTSLCFVVYVAPHR